MCRCSEVEGGEFYRLPRKIKEKNMKVRAFYFKIGVVNNATALPETMTLVYLPTITGGSGISEVNGAALTRSGGSVLLSLHRMRSAECSGKEAVFASTDRVRASDGTRFEVYVGDVKAVVGGLRKRRKEGEEEKWEVDCSCGEETTIGGVSGYEVRVAGEGGEVLRDKVKVPSVLTKERRRRRKGRKPFCMKLEQIPEEEEEGADDDDDDGSDSDESGSWCSCCCGDDKEERVEEEWELVTAAKEEVEVEAETIRWAVDVGIWVVSLGVGILVSKAALSPSRRKRRLLF